MMTLKCYNEEFKKLTQESGIPFKPELDSRRLQREQYIKYQTIRKLEKEQGVSSQADEDDIPINMGDQVMVELLSKFKKIEKKEICRLHKIFKKIAHGVDKPCSISPDIWLTREDLFVNIEMDFDTYCKIKHIYTDWLTYLSGTVVMIAKRERALEEEPLLFKPE